MSPRRKSAEDRKAEIVETALRLLQVTPVEKLSTASIAEKVGISQAAIFRHFPTKDSLWQAVLETVEKRALHSWDEAAAQETGPMRRLRAILKSQFALISAVPAVPVLIFSLGRVSAESAVRPIHRRVMSGLRARLLDELRAAASGGQIVALPEDDLADLFLGLVQGSVLRWRLADAAFDLVDEGMRLVDIQIGLIRRAEPGDVS